MSTKEQVLTVEQKKEFILCALGDMAQHTFPAICSVIGVHDSKTGRHLGSATRCILNGRRAILTAFHVIDAAIREPGGFAISTGYGERPFRVYGKVNIDPIGDLAVFFLPDDYPHLEEKNFWPATRIDRTLDRLHSDYLFFHGFPGISSYSSQLLNGVVSKSLPYGAMQRLDNLPPNLRPFEFAIEYDPIGMVSETGAPADVVDPHGLSGSPAWRIGVSGKSSKHWTPADSLLVGVVTQWRPDEKVLIATSTERIPKDW